MSLLNELDHYLEPNYNPNEWSDFLIDHATELVDSLHDTDWKILEEIWQNKPIGWQVRLADAAFGSEKPRVINLLTQMLKSSQVEVAIAAAESLEAKDYVWTPNSSLHAVLTNLLHRVKVEDSHIIENLLARIKHVN